GIGRLAIAVIGPQVLVVTRPERNKIAGELTVVAYIHWGLFELPGLDLEDIVIPIRELKGGTLPNATDVKGMVEEAKNSLEDILSRTDKRRIDVIRSQMSAFSANPAEYANYLEGPSLEGKGCGTHFYIIPADKIIENDIDYREDDRKATRFERNLIGFTNTMTPGHKRPPIVARFRDYIGEGEPLERIGEKTFFTPEEFKSVDHHFTGRFDEYGQFKGQVGIYQMKPEEYVLSWGGSDGSKTLCGPFSFSFAYMQGKASESLLPPDDHAKMKRKLDRHGGLYIYRDGIRVQPYGDSDYDFLDIERRRTLGTGYYFYSYRRMCGVVELNSVDNPSLTEKAGREGFRENKAYRQFRAILINFFLQTAADFFREEGKFADTWAEQKGELSRTEEIRKKKAKQVKEKKKNLSSDLEKFFDGADAGRYEEQVKEAVRIAKSKVDSVTALQQEPTQQAVSLMEVEKEARSMLNKIRSDMIIAKPRGVGLSRALTDQWTLYVAESQKLENELIAPAEAEVEHIVSAAAEAGELPLDDVTRLASSINEVGDQANKRIRRLRSETEEILVRVSQKAREMVKQSSKLVSRAV